MSIISSSVFEMGKFCKERIKGFWKMVPENTLM